MEGRMFEVEITFVDENNRQRYCYGELQRDTTIQVVMGEDLIDVLYRSDDNVKNFMDTHSGLMVEKIRVY